MLTEPAELIITCTEQLPELRVQDDGEKLTLPDPLFVNAMVPVGFEPVTVVVHVVDEPMVTELGRQLTDVVVDVGAGVRIFAK